MFHAHHPPRSAVGLSSQLQAALSLGLSLCISAPGFCGGPSPGKLYYVNTFCNTIYRMDLAQPDPQPVHFSIQNRFQLAVHECKMYWSSLSLDVVQRCNMDGTGVENVIESLGRPYGVAVDPVAEKLYFTTAFNGQNAVIRKANLDGSNPEIVLPLSNFYAFQLALDVSAGKMYWSESEVGVWRADLDGLNIEPVIASPNVAQFTLDLSTGQIYWTEQFEGLNNDFIRRANLDGSNPLDVLAGLEAPDDIAVDTAGGKVYWGDQQRKAIWRANLNGSQVEQLTPHGSCNPAGFFVVHGDVDAACGPHDPCPPKANCDALESIYWVDGGGGGPTSNGRIWRSDPDGTGLQMVHSLTAPYDLPFSIAIDKAGGKVYCTHLPTCGAPSCPAVHVFRVNLDGSDGIEPLVILPFVNGAIVTDIALDPSAGKMYFKRQSFPTPNQSTVYRANLDGTQIEVIYTTTAGSPGVGRLNLDAEDQRVYFSRSNKVVRANMSIVPWVLQDVIIESSGVRLVGCDFEGGKVYYLQNADPSCNFPSIPPLAKRANLDGTNIEILGTHANFEWCMSTAETLDIASQKLYRVPGSDPAGGATGILRSNFADGSSPFAVMFMQLAAGEMDVTLVMRDVVPGDITGDGVVNVNDLLAVVGTWGPCPRPPAPCPTDIAPAPNGDGVVNVNDLLMVIGNWS